MGLTTTIKQNLHYYKYSLLAMYYNAGEVKLQSLSSTHSMQLLSLGPSCTLVLWPMLHSAAGGSSAQLWALLYPCKLQRNLCHVRPANIEACRYT